MVRVNQAGTVKYTTACIRVFIYTIMYINLSFLLRINDCAGYKKNFMSNFIARRRLAVYYNIIFILLFYALSPRPTARLIRVEVGRRHIYNNTITIYYIHIFIYI